MNAEEPISEVLWELNPDDARSLRQRTSVCLSGAKLRVRGSTTQEGLFAGNSKPLSVTVDGNVGDFAFMLSSDAEYDVQGSVGTACGHSLRSGVIFVREQAGDSLGAFATGGFIVVMKQAGDRVGLGLAGADVLVRSVVGNEAGHGMTHGSLILANGAGENLGAGMSGGVIFVRGEAKSLSSQIRQSRMRDTDSLKLSLLLTRAKLKNVVNEFTAYRVVGAVD